MASHRHDQRSIYGGVVLRGCEADPDLLSLRRFLVRNYYPHRIEELANKTMNLATALLPSKMPEVELLDGRVLVRPPCGLERVLSFQMSAVGQSCRIMFILASAAVALSISCP